MKFEIFIQEPRRFPRLSELCMKNVHNKIEKVSKKRLLKRLSLTGWKFQLRSFKHSKTYFLMFQNEMARLFLSSPLSGLSTFAERNKITFCQNYTLESHKWQPVRIRSS